MPINIYSVHTLRNLRLFFNHTFKLDELWKVEANERKNQAEKRALQMGTEDKCMLTCVGVGFYNLNKVLI